MSSLCLVVLNYNNYSDTERCIHRLRTIKVPNSEVVVVDNHSSDDSLVRLKKLGNDFDFTLIESSQNNGFAAGNNLGIRYALKKNFKYVGILNNDLIVDTNIFSPMVDYLDSQQNVAVVGPSLWDNGKIINIGNNINYTRTSYDNAVSLSDFKEINDVDFLFGACLIVRLDAVRRVGLFPEMYFLNYEETEWCLKFKRQGYRVQCLASYKAEHQSGGTIGKFSGMQVYFLRRNIVLFERRNAPKKEKILFFMKLFFLSLAQCLHRMTLEPILSYADGITEKNRYDYLR